MRRRKVVREMTPREKAKCAHLEGVFGLEPEIAFQRVETLRVSELKMAELLMLGYNREQIEGETGIAFRTFHRRRAEIRRKLGVHTSAGIVRFYLCWKLVTEQNRILAEKKAIEVEVDWRMED